MSDTVGEQPLQDHARTTLVHVTTIPMSLTFLSGQIPYMKARGFDVHAVSSPGHDLRRFSRELDIPVTAVAMPRRITVLQDLRALVRMTRIFKALRPDIVHAHTPKGGLLGILASKLAGDSVRIYHMRGLPFASAVGFRRVVLRWTERIACSLAHRVFCVSHSLRRLAIGARLCPRDKVTVLAGGSGNGVDAMARFNPAQLEPSARGATRRRFGIPANALVIGFVGRIVRDKGIMELVEAWRRLRSEDATLHLLLVGPFEPQDPVPVDLAHELRSDSRVHLAGMDWNTAPLYAAMDVLALPTYREGFPNTPLEAAAMELPVVATRIPGCLDAIEEGVTGSLVAVRDARALADALRVYLRDPLLRRTHGQNGRARVLREFQPEMIWRALHAEYLDLLSKAGRPLPAEGKPSSQ